MNHPHNFNFVLGIYGDGQLARLLALKARAKKIPLIIYTLKASQSPCLDVADKFIEGNSWADETAFESFLKSIDVLALENEFIPPDYLSKAESKGITCYPNAKSYEAVCNKLKQVRLAESLGVKVPRTRLLETETSLHAIQPPLMLKALRGGYDGYGNFLYQASTDLDEARQFLNRAGPSLAQELIHFDREVAVMVLRQPSAQALAFPVVETIQEDNICHYTITPARIDAELLDKVQSEAKKLIEGIDGVGLFGVEFFIRGREVIFNEIAPRPHNSGHLSMEACNVGQFEALILLASKLPVPTPSLTVPSAGMLNILGTRKGEASFEGQGFKSPPLGFLHLYGKKESRPGRKMGHYTLLGQNAEHILEELGELKTRYQI